jgi:integrase
MSIRKRKLKNGKYSYQAVIERGFDCNGNRLRETKTFATKKEAEAYYNSQKTSIANGTYIEPNKLTVSQALDEWMETEVKPRLAPATVASYEKNIENHIKPALGGIQLQKLTPVAVQNFYNSLDKDKGLSQRSIKYINDNLHCCLKHFVNAQVIPKNVCDFANVPKKRSDKPKNDFYSMEETQQLLQAVDKDRMMPVVYLGLLGLRRSEMLALTWSDIDMVNNTIDINKNLVVVNGVKTIGKCKTQSSVRKITVPSTVIEKLQEHRRRQVVERMASIGSYSNNNLVICKHNGDYISPASLSSMFPEMLRKYGLRKIRLHDLRHTYCSLGINYFHIPATVIAQQAGHSSPKVTMGIYSHSNVELQKESSDIFEEKLFGEVKKKLG